MHENAAYLWPRPDTQERTFGGSMLHSCDLDRREPLVALCCIVVT